MKSLVNTELPILELSQSPTNWLTVTGMPTHPGSFPTAAGVGCRSRRSLGRPGHHPNPTGRFRWPSTFRARGYDNGSTPPRLHPVTACIGGMRPPKPAGGRAPRRANKAGNDGSADSTKGKLAHRPIYPSAHPPPRVCSPCSDGPSPPPSAEPRMRGQQGGGGKLPSLLECGQKPAGSTSQQKKVARSGKSERDRNLGAAATLRQDPVRVTNDARNEPTERTALPQPPSPFGAEEKCATAVPGLPLS